MLYWELCAPAFKRAETINPRFWELFSSWEYAAEIDPRSCGEPHPADIFGGKEMLYGMLPAIGTLPALVIFYEVAGDTSGDVIVYNVYAVHPKQNGAEVINLRE